MARRATAPFRADRFQAEFEPAITALADRLIAGFKDRGEV